MLTLSSPEKKTDSVRHRDRDLGLALAAQTGLSRMDSMWREGRQQRNGLCELGHQHQIKSNSLKTSEKI